MPHFLSPLLLATEAFLVFVCLTIYGAMWHGAQEHRENGWVIAILSTMVILSA